MLELEEIQMKLKKYGQEHLLKFYNQLNNQEKTSLLEQIKNIDFEKMNELIKKVDEEINFLNQNIEPIEYVDKYAISVEELKTYEDLGETVIKNGKLAVVTMAGGQGTRLGHNGPKGTYNIGINNKSIFEILCDTLKMAEKKYGKKVQWYIMTSKENNNTTIEFFESNNYFNYGKENIKFFTQGEMPMVSEDGKLLLETKFKIKEAADGHGGVFESMYNHNIINDMKLKGIEWVYIGGVDNILAQMVDPVLIGVALANNKVSAGKSVLKASPDEKVGVFCKKNGRPSVIEYSEINEEMAQRRNEKGELVFGESHLLCNLFNISIIEKVAKHSLPYHVAHKKAEYIDENGNVVVPKEPNAYKFESFIFDAFADMDNMIVLRGKREEEFAPVKNAEGNDSPETARNLYKNYYGI